MPPDPCIRSHTYLYARVWRCETKGPYEKFLADEKAQIAKRV